MKTFGGIDGFGEATGDQQWIHVDPARAAGGPFGATTAHGFLIVSMIPRMVRQIYTVDGLAMVVNYGLNRVRFPSPVPVGSKVRAGAELVELTRRPSGGLKTVRVTIERQGGDKPGCGAETVSVLVA
jgi:acyl dehydratase